MIDKSFLAGSDRVPTEVSRLRPEGRLNNELQLVGSAYPIVQQHPVLIFVLENQSQIHQKAIKYGVDVADVSQDVCLVFLEKISNFDPSCGSLRSYIFGHLDKLLHRQSFGALRFAVSLDDDGERAEIIRGQVESAATLDADETITYDKRSTAPGQESLEAIAEIISGKSANQLAVERGVSKRRINQILKKVRENATVQFDFEFTKESK